MGFLSSVTDALFGGDDAGDAAKEGAQISADAQREALEYLKQKEAAPTHYRDYAMGTLANYYGIPGYQPQAPQQAWQQGVQQQQQGLLGGLVNGGGRGKSKTRYVPGGGGGGPPASTFGTGGGSGGISGMIGRIKADDKAYREWEQQQQQGQQAPMNYGDPVIGTFADNMQPRDYTQEIMGGSEYQNILRQNEQRIMANAAMTGGVRSGNVQDAFVTNNQNLLQNLNRERQQRDDMNTQNYLSGIGGMAQIPQNTNQIASTMTGIGNTLAQGHIAAGQAQQASRGMGLNALLGFGGIASGEGWL